MSTTTATASYNKQKVKTKNTEVKIWDVIQFVAGTMDPTNMTAEKHEANFGYWECSEEDCQNLWANIKALKGKYEQLHISDKYYSWSGDNSYQERVLAAERLWDQLWRVYKEQEHTQINFHLIGHSHGGNVINQFTELISKSEYIFTYRIDSNGNPLTRVLKFPDKWVIKSITYLSTPFFNDQHQLMHTRLHKDCKIINIYNEFDLTQRFIARYTLKNLEKLNHFVRLLSGKIHSKSPNLDEIDQQFIKGKDLLGKVNMAAFKVLGKDEDYKFWTSFSDGPVLWTAGADLLDGVFEAMTAIQRSLDRLKEQGIDSVARDGFRARVTEIINWSNKQRVLLRKNIKDRNDGYSTKKFFVDLDLQTCLNIANKIFAVNEGSGKTVDTYLMGLLAYLFSDGPGGIVDKIDYTSWHPEGQTKELEIFYENIRIKDPYDKHPLSGSFDKFVDGLEECFNSPDQGTHYQTQEILMRLISQEVDLELFDGDPDDDDDSGLIGQVDTLQYLYTNGYSMDRSLKKLEKNLTLYRDLIKKYQVKLVLKKDSQNKKLKIKPGSTVYLAWTSHSLSHKDFYEEIEKGLKGAIVTPLNG